MLRTVIKKIFDVREGEFKISFLMAAYIFLIIAVLLIIKPTVNALFLSDIGIEHLPFAFLLVALTAVLSSFAYSKALTKFSLRKLIEVTLISSFVVLVVLGILLYLNRANGFILYFFYVWVAIYAVLSTSQFWVLANMVFNVREAKRLFGFIGSGAILGGIFGGYATSLLAPYVNSEILLFIAAFLLIFCISILRNIWKFRVADLNTFKQVKRSEVVFDEQPLSLIKKSKHLTYIAFVVAVSVLVAKLVDYLFSDFASKAIPDTEELTAFFGFWFSTFNLVSLLVQLFFTRRIVGVLGVGFSLFLLPLGIFLGGVTFFILPELSVIIVIKAMDGVLKQSVQKSATELLALPLPLDLKKKTKSFIDVVVDSMATGLAGFVLIFVIQGLELPSIYIVGIILILVVVWAYFIYQVRKEYFRTFRKNLEYITNKIKDKQKGPNKRVSVIDGMCSVLKNGTEKQILFMLGKLLEINDKQFLPEVEALLEHPSTKVRTEAIKNLYCLNPKAMVRNINQLLGSDDDDLTIATLDYLLMHAQKNSGIIYDTYLDHENNHIADASLFCLAREAHDNTAVGVVYNLRDRIQKKIEADTTTLDPVAISQLLKTIGHSDISEFYPEISKYLKASDPKVVAAAIEAAGLTLDGFFIEDLMSFLPNKTYRKMAIEALQYYGNEIIPILTKSVEERRIPLETCRYVPSVLKSFNSQLIVTQLFKLLKDSDLGIRVEVIKALSDLRKKNTALKFDNYKVADLILEECKQYHMTLSAMHNQIIIAFRNRKRNHKEIRIEERDARASLLELLERRLDAGLERIFKLLGLKYKQRDVQIAYKSLLSDKEEARANAIEFLDNLLTGNLKRTLLPIIEATVLDVSSEEALQLIIHKIPTEQECFKMLLHGNDLKVKLAVLYLIRQQQEPAYIPILEEQSKSADLKIRTFAQEALQSMT